MGLKCLIFDLDNTLYDENSYFLEVFKTFARRNNIEFSKIDNVFSFSLRQNSNDVFGDVLKKLDLFSQELQEELFELYKTVDVKLKLYQDAEKLINFARKMGLKLGIITNGVVDVQRNKVKCLGIESLFDSIVYARKFGKENEKPSPEPYRSILGELKVNPQETIYVGDDPRIDLQGAEALNIATILIGKEYKKDS